LTREKKKGKYVKERLGEGRRSLLTGKFVDRPKKIPLTTLPARKTGLFTAGEERKRGTGLERARKKASGGAVGERRVCGSNGRAPRSSSTPKKER